MAELYDYLMPGEEVRFISDRFVDYAGKRWKVALTNKRFILFAKRGLLRRVDLVSWKLEDIQGIRFKEKGLISKKGIIEVHGKTTLTLEGPVKIMKPLYDQLLEHWEK